jgi:hypothetical protein
VEVAFKVNPKQLVDDANVLLDMLSEQEGFKGGEMEVQQLIAHTVRTLARLHLVQMSIITTAVNVGADAENLSMSAFNLALKCLGDKAAGLVVPTGIATPDTKH